LIIMREHFAQLTASLAEFIREQLLAVGHAHGELTELAPVTPGIWRRTARHVGRDLNRPVRTWHARGHVWATLEDWPTTAEEIRIHHTALLAMRDAAGTDTP
jgi:hypothetical protein